METVTHRRVSDLVPLPGNPRTISDADFARLVESVNKFGILEGRPLILSDRTGELVVIGGNQRLKAAKHLGIETVPTFLLSGLTEEDERELVIRDNVSNGDWDELALKTEWDVKDLADWGLGSSTWESPAAKPKEKPAAPPFERSMLGQTWDVMGNTLTCDNPETCDIIRKALAKSNIPVTEA